MAGYDGDWAGSFTQGANAVSGVLEKKRAGEQEMAESAKADQVNSLAGQYAAERRAGSEGDEIFGQLAAMDVNAAQGLAKLYDNIKKTEKEDADAIVAGIINKRGAELAGVQMSKDPSVAYKKLRASKDKKEQAIMPGDYDPDYVTHHIAVSAGGLDYLQNRSKISETEGKNAISEQEALSRIDLNKAKAEETREEGRGGSSRQSGGKSGDDDLTGREKARKDVLKAKASRAAKMLENEIMLQPKEAAAWRKELNDASAELDKLTRGKQPIAPMSNTTQSGVPWSMVIDK